MNEEIADALKIKETNQIDYLDELLDLHDKYPDDLTVLNLLAHALWEQNNDDTIEIAKKIIDIDPKNESASLILFHTYWHFGRFQEAVNEMIRFQDISESEDYDCFEEFIKVWKKKRQKFDFSKLE